MAFFLQGNRRSCSGLLLEETSTLERHKHIIRVRLTYEALVGILPNRSTSTPGRLNSTPGPPPNLKLAVSLADADVVHALSACEVCGVLTGGLILLYCGPVVAASTLAAVQLVALAVAQLVLCVPHRRPEHAPPALLSQQNGATDVVSFEAEPLPVWDDRQDAESEQQQQQQHSPPLQVRTRLSTRCVPMHVD